MIYLLQQVMILLYYLWATPKVLLPVTVSLTAILNCYSLVGRELNNQSEKEVFVNTGVLLGNKNLLLWSVAYKSAQPLQEENSQLKEEQTRNTAMNEDQFFGWSNLTSS